MAGQVPPEPASPKPAPLADQRGDSALAPHVPRAAAAVRCSSTSWPPYSTRTARRSMSDPVPKRASRLFVVNSGSSRPNGNGVSWWVDSLPRTALGTIDRPRLDAVVAQVAIGATTGSHPDRLLDPP